MPVSTSVPPVPTQTVTPLPPVLTVAEARAQCIAEGVVLEPALTNCINDKMTP